MTQREYYLSDALQGEATVLRCEQNAQGHYEVELDKTWFHPQGGGQPADQGTINRFPVLHVENRGDTVLHLLAQPVATGLVELVVDASVRRRHTRWHSAGHLIGYAGEQLGWRPVKAHPLARRRENHLCPGHGRRRARQRRAGTGYRHVDCRRSAAAG